jgi:hypothetical protein
MISYKQWKLLNENLDSDAVLGISRPANLGIAGEALSLHGMMTKKMHAGVPHPDDMDDEMGDKGDMGDEDMGDEEHGDMGDEDMGDEGDMDHDEEEGEEGEEEHPHDELGHDMPMKKKKKPMVPPDLGMAGAGGPDVGAALGAGGPGIAKQAYMNYMKKEAHDDDEEEEEEEPEDMDHEEPEEDMGDEEHGDTACCAKCGKMDYSKKSKKSKKCCKMTKEEREFYESLRRQLGGVKFKQDQYGYWIPVKEDVLIPPAEQPAEDAPGPGEVGFAPQQKVAMIGSNFKEWASHHKQQVKKSKK